MSRRMFYFDPPDRFVAGTIGEPGQRTFFLQARKASQIVSVVLEKVQVQVLAERLDQLLDELEQNGVAASSAAATPDTEPLDEPLVEAFRATTLTLGWDPDAEQVLVEARADPVEVEVEIDPDDIELIDEEAAAVEASGATVELDAGLAASIRAAFEAAAAEAGDEEEDDLEGPDVLRVRVSAATARSFVERAARVVASGRPPCPMCGQPLDPQGHICPRRNGHYVN
ncbi:MAG TPA: DUF3090 family protein [Candidatus Limnocylindrales bacterium]|nr:DUF3090 family protein [Candidatus Limnocylindrales bacterium]